MSGRLELVPLSVTAARVAVHKLHRHLPKMVGGLFGSSVYVGPELVGVAVASEPKAPALRGRRIVEITRCATDGHKNACSKLLGALCRASAAIGYLEARTYTRLDEPGTSLRAAGFFDDGVTEEQSWDRPRAPRSGELSQVRRWVKGLSKECFAALAAKRALAAEQANPFWELSPSERKSAQRALAQVGAQ